MKSLRDVWRAGPVYRYFADMEPLDRATAIIVLALLVAWAVAFGAIVRDGGPALSSEPFIPTPFDMRFTAARAPS